MAYPIEDLPWRPPQHPDWTLRFEELSDRVSALAREGTRQSDNEAVAIELRRLANMRLGDVERLRLARMAKRLWPLRMDLPTLRPFHIVVLGNRTFDLFANEICAAAPARGLLVKVSCGDYDSAAAVAMGAGTLDLTDPVDAILLYLDHKAFLWPAHLLDPSEQSDRLAYATTQLKTIAVGLQQRLSAPVIVATAAVPAESHTASVDGAVPGTSTSFIHALNEMIFAGVAAGDWQIWDVAGLAGEIGTQRWFDPIHAHKSKFPHAPELNALAADHVCRVLASMTGKTARALILDLDNTLWGGTIGDDGLENIRLGPGSSEGEAFVAFQKAVLNIRARGVALAICSKNDQSIAKQPFLQHPEMALQLDQIAVFQANWIDKASNIKTIAEKLRLGLESIVFIDDNPAERERVRQELPLVFVPEMDADPAYFPHILNACGYFEHGILNRDDLARPANYGAIVQRADISACVGNYDEYLKSLQMTMSISRFDRLNRSRVTQLINKSNQFNLTTRRYNEVEVAGLETDSERLAWYIRLKDIFGDQGIIGIVIVKKEILIWDIDSWLMSCRVLERGVEQTIMNELIAYAKAHRVVELRGTYVPTARNGLVSDFYDKMMFKKNYESETTTQYTLDVASYCALPSMIAVDQRPDAPI